MRAGARRRPLPGCGEKRPEARDLSVRHFFGEAAQGLTSVGHSKLFHTLRALLFRPGLLTNEWVAGRRRRHLKPLNLCPGIFGSPSCRWC